MLLKFRWNTVGLTEDIEKAFPMVGIQEQDRDMLRFLWLMSRSLQDQQFYRFVFGVRPSPSILGATMSHHLKKYKQSEPEIAKLLEESLCIDDLITGEDNVNKAFSVYEESRQVMS